MFLPLVYISTGKPDNSRRKTAEFQAPEPRKRIDKNPKTTVFISNLHHTVDEEKLKEIFPNAKLLEIVRDRKGKSRCYGMYLEPNKIATVIFEQIFYFAR